MRLLLDAHVSGARVGGPLEAAGHDVRALDREPQLEGLDDEGVLELAAHEQRILITHDVADFPRILRQWAADGRSHAGVILVYGIDHSRFDVIVRGVQHWLELRTEQGEWRDFPAVVDRALRSGS